MARLGIAAQSSPILDGRRVRISSATSSFWREASYRTDRRYSRCRCSRTTNGTLSVTSKRYVVHPISDPQHRSLSGGPDRYASSLACHARNTEVCSIMAVVASPAAAQITYLLRQIMVDVILNKTLQTELTIKRQFELGQLVKAIVTPCGEETDPYLD